MNNLVLEKDKEIKLAEYIIERILNGDVFFLCSEELAKIQEKGSNVKFERTGIDVKLRKYGNVSTLFFLKKDKKLKNYSSDVYIPAGANWETLFGFYFEDCLPIKVHVYFIGKEFDLDKLSEMIYSLFTDTEKDHIKISNIAYRWQ
jgi:hypothetical protein